MDVGCDVRLALSSQGEREEGCCCGRFLRYLDSPIARLFTEQTPFGHELIASGLKHNSHAPGTQVDNVGRAWAESELDEVAIQLDEPSRKAVEALGQRSRCQRQSQSMTAVPAGRCRGRHCRRVHRHVAGREFVGI